MELADEINRISGYLERESLKQRANPEQSSSSEDSNPNPRADRIQGGADPLELLLKKKLDSEEAKDKSGGKTTKESNPYHKDESEDCKDSDENCNDFEGFCKILRWEAYNYCQKTCKLCSKDKQPPLS